MFTCSRARILTALLVVTLITLASAMPAAAAVIRNGENVVIAADEVIDDDLFVSGQSVTINGTVTGDLVATGGTIIVNGVVEGSTLIAAQSVDIGGRIDGSLYATGYALSLGNGATVGRNLYFGGYALTTAPQSDVYRSAYVGSYQMLHRGRVEGDLAVQLAALQLDGAVGGDVVGAIEYSQDASQVNPETFMPPGAVPTVEAVAPGLHISDAAEIGGEVLATERVIETPQAPTTGFLGLPLWLLDRVGEFIGLMLFGALLVGVLPRSLPALEQKLRTGPLQSLGWGALAAFLLLPFGLAFGLALVILLAVLMGVITFGEMAGMTIIAAGGLLLLALLAYLLVAYIGAKLVVGYWGGRVLLSLVGLRSDGRWVQLAFLALGLLIYEVLRAIPVLGFALALMVMLFGLGAVILAVTRRGIAAAPSSKEDVVVAPVA